MFENELRFYREIAPEVAIRVPECYQATETDDGFRLVLEDLSGWQEGGDVVQLARVLAQLHRRWEGRAEQRWPWLKRAGKAADVIGELYDRCWADILQRPDVTPVIRDLGQRFVGKVAEIERDEAGIGPKTLIQGDASFHNARTSPGGVVAFLDWEDVRSSAGSIDLTWLLVSSVDPAGWDAVIDAYRPDEAEFKAALPHAVTQGILGFAGSDPGSPTATGWASRLEAVADRVG